jgi:hypothetical protein
MENQITPAVAKAEIPKRRTFLGWILGGAGLAAGAGIVGFKLLKRADSGVALPASLPPLPTRENFAAQLRSDFAVSAGTAPAVQLKLVEVSESKTQKAGDRTFQSYSIFFEGPKSAPLPQDTCGFKHPALGKFDLFVVPIGKPKGDVVRYQAAFTIFS